MIQADGQVKVIGPQLLGRLHLDEPAPLGENPSPARLILPISRRPALLAFTDAGRVALLRWEFAGQNPGTLEKFLPEGMTGERVVQLLPLPQEAEGKSVGLLSSDGRFKRLPLAEFQDLSGRATSILKLKEGVSLKRVANCKEGRDLVDGSSWSMLRIEVNALDLAIMSKNAKSPMVMRLLPGEETIGTAEADSGNSLLVGSQKKIIRKLQLGLLKPATGGFLGKLIAISRIRVIFSRILKQIQRGPLRNAYRVGKALKCMGGTLKTHARKADYEKAVRE